MNDGAELQLQQRNRVYKLTETRNTDREKNHSHDHSLPSSPPLSFIQLHQAGPNATPCKNKQSEAINPSTERHTRDNNNNCSNLSFFPLFLSPKLLFLFARLPQLYSADNYLSCSPLFQGLDVYCFFYVYDWDMFPGNPSHVMTGCLSPREITLNPRGVTFENLEQFSEKGFSCLNSIQYPPASQQCHGLCGRQCAHTQSDISIEMSLAFVIINRH